MFKNFPFVNTLQKKNALSLQLFSFYVVMDSVLSLKIKPFYYKISHNT